MNITNLGPGAGKTTSALQLITNLLRDPSLPPSSNIIYITITNASSMDAADRLERNNVLTKAERARVQVSTMHTYLMNIIRTSSQYEGFNLTATPDVTWSNNFELRDLPSNYIADKQEWLHSSEAEFYNEEEKADYIQRHFDEPYARNSRRFMEFVNANFINTQNGQLTIPLECLLDVVLCSGIEIPKEDILIADEYQDLHQREIIVFTTLFSPTRTFLFGDINQSIYQFRVDERERERELASTNKNSHQRTITYRLHQDTCNILNRIIKMKRAINELVFSRTTLITELVSAKDDPGYPSMRLVPADDFYSRQGNLFKTKEKPEIVFPIELQELMNEKMGDFLFIHNYNVGAQLFTESLTQKWFKGENLYSWYIPVHTARLYKDIRFLLTGNDNNANAEAVYQIMRDVMNALGQRLPTGTDAKILGISSRRKHTAKRYEDHVTIQDFRQRMQMFIQGKVSKAYMMGFKASPKSSHSANMTILNMIVSKGLSAAMSAVRVYRDKQEATADYRCGIYTIHSVKGLEADYTFVDLTSGFTINERTEASIQQAINMLYVALSRHIEQSFIIYDDSQFGRLKVKNMLGENAAMMATYNQDTDSYDSDDVDSYDSLIDESEMEAFLSRDENTDSYTDGINALALAEQELAFSPEDIKNKFAQRLTASAIRLRNYVTSGKFSDTRGKFTQSSRFLTLLLYCSFTDEATDAAIAYMNQAKTELF